MSVKKKKKKRPSLNQRAEEILIVIEVSLPCSSLLLVNKNLLSTSHVPCSVPASLEVQRETHNRVEEAGMPKNTRVSVCVRVS